MKGLVDVKNLVEMRLKEFESAMVCLLKYLQEVDPLLLKYNLHLNSYRKILINNKRRRHFGCICLNLFVKNGCFKKKTILYFWVSLFKLFLLK